MFWDEKNPEKFTINTRKGLFQYISLTFVISSVPKSLQRTMENLLQGIPQVIIWMDDILLSRIDDNDHLTNLEALLKKLSAAGLRLAALAAYEYKISNIAGETNAMRMCKVVPHCLWC